MHQRVGRVDVAAFNRTGGQHLAGSRVQLLARYRAEQSVLATLHLLGRTSNYFDAPHRSHRGRTLALGNDGQRAVPTNGEALVRRDCDRAAFAQYR